MNIPKVTRLSQTKNMNTNQLNINFTGKASVIIELEEYGPLQFNINDINIVCELVSVLIAEQSSTVDVYSTTEEKKLKSILTKIK